MDATESKIGSVEAQTGVAVVIERPPAEVFAELINVAGYTAWARGPEEVMDISDDPVRLGTTWQQAGKVLGRKIVTKLQVNAYEENREFGYGSDKPFPMQFVFTLAPVPGGTELRMIASGDPTSIFSKVALPILTRSVERQMESDLYALKGILENGA